MIGQLFSLFSGDAGTGQIMFTLTNLAALVFVILFCMSAHEFAHAWMAKKLGDDTAFQRGRLTLDPMKHLDLFGTLLLLTVGVGYAKPVPVSPGRFNSLKFKTKRVKKGMALVAAAGPATNLMIALLFFGLRFLMGTIMVRSIIASGTSGAMEFAPNDINLILYMFCDFVASSNLWLALFNLLPVPPLDGSRILDLFLPLRASIWLEHNEHYFRYGLFAVIIALRIIPSIW